MKPEKTQVAVVLGSAFDEPVLGGRELVPVSVPTEFGEATLHRYGEKGYALFRHGVPHRYLPNQIPYRAQLRALAQVGVRALLLTSSVGVMDPEVPLFEPLLVSDLLMPENRLPDGSSCTLYVEPTAGQGHLLLDEGIFSKELSNQLRTLAAREGISLREPVVFAYVPGPRSKTAAENRYWRMAGAQVNSMSLAPEAVLANELEIPVAALVVGHKHSNPDKAQAMDVVTIQESLKRSHQATERLAVRFLEEATPVEFRNRVYRY